MNRTARRPSRGRSAFTVLEVMFVVSILGILLAMAMPAIQRIVIVSRATTMANDLRVYAHAFLTYSQEHDTYPRDTRTDVVPAGMEDLLGPGWLEPTPIGGYYNYEYNKKAQGTRYTAAIGIRTKGKEKVTNDANLLLALDRILDDGDLTTGSFLLGPGNAPFYVIEQ